MKYKKLTREQLIISADRLTRFKPTYQKYYRVFADIILSNLIEPKIKKSELEKADLKDICEYAQTIINSSFEFQKNSDNSINKILEKHENDLFENDKDTQKLLKNEINYDGIIEILEREKDLPINLKWLCSLKNGKTREDNREELSLKFPLTKLLLVEGITEETLLPVFSKLYGIDFDKKGIQLVSAGGKNQVVKLYYQYSEMIKIPIYVLLDADGVENAEQIRKKLRPQDKIHLVSCGEFEDILPKTLIVKTLNSLFKNFSKIQSSDFVKNLPMVKQLEELFKEKWTQEFKKAEFAKLVSQKVSCKSDIPKEIETILSEMNG
ncbi:hypothetical protein IJI31_06045 [bacterium]|nr:hypothetical protein [bacterium]